MSNNIFTVTCPVCDQDFEVKEGDYDAYRNIEQHILVCDGEYSDSAQCHSCQYETRQLNLSIDRLSREPVMFFCEICYSTHASNAVRHPDQYRGQQELFRMIGFVGNKIIEEVRKGRNEQ